MNEQIILVADFNAEQQGLAKDLLDQLEDACHELEEFSHVTVFGLKLKNNEWSILFEIGYSDPEENGNITIFNQY